MGYYDIRDCLTVTVGTGILSLILLWVNSIIRRQCCKKGALKCCGRLTSALFYILLFAACMSTWYLVHKQLYWPRVENAWALGMVDHESAKVWIHSEGDKKIRLGYSEFDSGKEELSPAVQLNQANNWTTVIWLHKLRPTIKYSYRVESDVPLGDHFSGTFTTFPAPYSKANIKFNFGSCLMPVPWTYMRIFDFWGEQDLTFSMLIGDAVYLDTFGIIPPEQAYPQILDDPVFSKFHQNTPNYFMYDDHEIINDYDGGADSELFKSTMAFWNHYFGQKNPVTDPKALYYNFTIGDVGVFVMDNRMYRSPSLDKDGPGKTILGPRQLQDLKNFLLDTGLTFKFVVSPVPYTVRLDLIDGWQGYIYEREQILDFIEDNSISGCVFLSADSHFSGAYQMRPWAIEYSASPLYAIPLVQSVYFHPEDHPVLHPTAGYVINDHQLWATDISHGIAFTYGHIEVNTNTPEPWYRVSIYGFNFFGNFGASPVLKMKKFLTDTVPTKEAKTCTVKSLD